MKKSSATIKNNIRSSHDLSIRKKIVIKTQID